MQTPYSLMIIEDDPEIRQLLEILLERDPRIALVNSFDNVADALVALRRGGPDVILCDVGLPGMTGIEALPRLRDACPDTVIVMYTGDTEGAHEAVERGADAVVGKETGPVRLFGQVLQLLQQKAYR